MVKNVCQKEKNISHPLFGISFKKWLDLLIYNRGFEPEYFTRVFFITLTSISLIPLRFLFKIFYGPLIEKTMVKHPPIFIIGHWRSGTTFLHELISQDPQIGYVSLWQTLLPESFLILEKSKEGNFAEITLHVSGKDLVSSESSDDIIKSIDFAVEKMERQLKKFKEKRYSH